MKPVFGEPNVVGYEFTLEELYVDYETYKFLHTSSASGFMMSPQQMERFNQLKDIFEAKEPK